MTIVFRNLIIAPSRSILNEGGSAVDAAIATLFCNSMVTMQSMGLGGGFLMTIYIKEEQTAYALNARETAPSKATSQLYKNDKLTSQNGPLAIAVPGELRGYQAAHQKFGKLKWATLIQPTIDLCEKGYEMSKHQYDSLQKARLLNDSNLREWFHNSEGEFKKMGSVIKPKKLCDTLRLVAQNGGDDLYNGTLGKMLLEDLEEMGSLITKEDLENYKAEWMEPIMVELRHKERIYSVPPPGSGVLLGFIMNILDGFKFKPNDIQGVDNTVQTYHKIIEAFKYAYAKRTQLGDTSVVNITNLLHNLTSPEYAAGIRREIEENSTSNDPRDYGAKFYNKDDHGTAHISVLAENGDAVSVTSSINLFFGAGLTSQQTGIILNSVMDDFSFPYFRNYFDLPGSPNNELKPGKRPLSSMSPSILVDENGDVKLVIG
ncbi:G glu transpept domain containing protein, partial [Asbolus verrucosus]